MADPQCPDGQPSQDAESTAPRQLSAEIEPTEESVASISPESPDDADPDPDPDPGPARVHPEENDVAADDAGTDDAGAEGAAADAQPEGNRGDLADTLVDEGSPTTRRLVVMPPQDKRSISLPSGATMARWTGRTDHSAPARPTGSSESPEAAETEVAASAPSRLRTPTPKPAVGAGGGAARQGQPEPTDPATGDRTWMTPLFGSVAALILLVVFAFGVMLIVRATTSDDEPGSHSSSRPLASSPLPERSTASPETRPSQRDPADTSQVVLVPAVIGLSESEATKNMNWSGLRVSVQWRTSETARPGTVVATDPAAGTPVASGSVVVLYLAQQPPSPSTSGGSEPPSSAPASISPSA